MTYQTIPQYPDIIFSKPRVVSPEELAEDEQYMKRYREKFKDTLENYWYTPQLKSIKSFTNDTLRFYGLFVDLYGYNVALEMIRKHTLEVAKEIADAVRQVATDKGLNWKEKPLEAFLEGQKALKEGYYDWSLFKPVWDSEGSDMPKVRCCCIECHIGHALQQMNPKDQMLMRQWCDRDLWTGPLFDPRIKTLRPKFMGDGNLYCKWINYDSSKYTPTL